jgi:YfiR/HmsC-like
MIGRIAEFIRWPADSGMDDPERPLEFVILGSTPLESRLARYYGRVRIAGHRVFLRRAQTISDVGSPQLLFVAPNMSDELPRILAAIGRSHVLTMGDTEGFADRGLAVNIFIQDDQLRFEVSRRALGRHGLQASYRLLELAVLKGEVREARR